MTPCWRIGTSGWHYPHWHGVFYPGNLPPGKWLEYYACHFDSVEINSSFYRLPTEQTVTQWRDATPDNFRFAVKASRLISHMKKFSDVTDYLSIFIDRIQGLGSKLGPILFQSSPQWQKDSARLKDFLSLLPQGMRWAFEFRHPSWHCKEIYRLLNARGVAFCIYDLAGFTAPAVVTADYAYLRLHGPEAAYCGRYGEERLTSWVEWLSRQTGLQQVYLYFDNDQAGHAVEDALLLRRLVGQPVLP
ncbi:MAG: DUF72 domain-containing protein [Sulfuricellaceae bacterium]